MQILSMVLVGVGFCCLLAGWIFSRAVKRKGLHERLCRGILSKIKKGNNNSDPHILTVSFSSPEGTIFHYTEKVQQRSSWYEGMPLLVRYSYEEKKLNVLRIQTYQEAYGKPFTFLMGGILLIIAGSLLL